MGDMTAALFYGAKINKSQLQKLAHLMYDEYDPSDNVDWHDLKDEKSLLELKENEGGEYFLVVRDTYKETDNVTKFLGLNLNESPYNILKVMDGLKVVEIDSEKIKQIGWFLQPSYN